MFLFHFENSAIEDRIEGILVRPPMHTHMFSYPPFCQQPNIIIHIKFNSSFCLHRFPNSSLPYHINSMGKLLILFIFILLSLPNLSFSTSITTSSTDQTPCTMCYSCENPCQPLPSPPPPVIVCPPPPPSPPPPPPTGPLCPPPPKLHPRTPDTGIIGGAYYPPPTGGELSPPNPEVPYFPYYYNYPPAPPSSVTSNSVALRLKLVVPSIFLFLTMQRFF